MANTVSPSRIARYYFHECARFLRYSSTPQAEREAQGIPEIPFQFQPVTEAIFERGYAWEEEVVGELIADQVVLGPADPGGQLRDRMMSVDDTNRALASLKAGEYLYQPTLRTPDAFYEFYGIDPAKVQFSDCRPDLLSCLEIDDRLVIRVIDIKASPGLKLAHRIQATLYTLILRYVLADLGLDGFHLDDQAGIWLSQEPEPEWFDVRSMRPPLETFLETELQPLLEKPAHEAAWHVYYRCEWCEYFEHCQQQMRDTDSISRIPYLSTHAKQFLAELEPPVRTISEFEALLNDKKNLPLLDTCASLRGKASRIQRQIESLKSNQELPFGGSSLAMPKAEHVRVVFTAQSEPVSGQLYAYGIYAQGLKDLQDDKTMTVTEVAEDSDPATIDELERNLVCELYDLFVLVHNFNIDHEKEWKKQKTLQVYAFDSYERTLLTDVLLRRIFDPEIAEEALQVFFHFQQPELMEATSHPADEVFFPVVVLTDVLRSLFALPSEITYRFADVSQVLKPSQFAFDFTPNPYFTFPLSNQMRSDAIFQVWNRDKTENLERIDKELRARLWGTNSTINGIRERLNNTDTLFAWPPKFTLPASFDHNHELLSRLAFLTRYESIIGYLGLRERRMAPLTERLQSGESLRLEFLGEDRFAVDPRQWHLRIGEDGFPQWLLAEESDVGHRALLSYDDYANRKRVWVPKNLRLAIAGIKGVEGTLEAPTQFLRLDLTSSAAMPPLKTGQLYTLTPRFTDFNSDRVIAELDEIDAEEDPPYIRLIEEPHEFAAPLDVPPGIRDHAIKLAQSQGMTNSQLAAFEGTVMNGLQLVWGPPGTGKTHFLATAILCLSEAYRTHDEPFRVLLTGFTHSAIDNCLKKLAEIQRTSRVFQGDFPIAKLSRTTLPDMDDVQVVDDKAGYAWAKKFEICTVGSTVWAMRKGFPSESADLVVIDEGSQVRVPEASIAVRRMASDGRLLIAGDDQQLPPIVQGSYPDDADELLLHRSIFECLKDQDPDNEFTTTLLENWRMNEALCWYPAEQIYVPEYRSATEEIAQRLIHLDDMDAADDLVRFFLDPKFPLAVGILDGVRATAENVVEAELVSRLALTLRECLRNRTGKPFEDTGLGDKDFWEHGLFIVSPHHVQINAIRSALKKGRDWLADPFVDTVDKMQGQECDSVIVSYGVSDAEYAMNEKDFIYSLNRLNVAITRARAKTIVFLPHPLINPPIQAYEDEYTAAGVAFMQGLAHFASRHGEGRDFDLGEAAKLRAYRVAHEHLPSNSITATLVGYLPST